jgi:hypothetical protein
MGQASLARHVNDHHALFVLEIGAKLVGPSVYVPDLDVSDADLLGGDGVAFAFLPRLAALATHKLNIN